MIVRTQKRDKETGMSTTTPTPPSPQASPHHSPARACRVEDVPRWDIETDVAVIGFGAAGSCAAIEARAAGAEVHVFEVAAAPGGSVTRPSATSAIRSPGSFSRSDRPLM